MKWWPFAKARPDVQPGQVSEPEDNINGIISRIAGFYNFTAAPFDLKALELLELLGMFNPDISQALSIWVNLGNTGHEVTVDSRSPDAVLQRLNTLAATCYQTGGGVDGLVNHFLRQIPLMGALSGEWVVADRVNDGLVDCVTVPVKRIRWQRVDGAWAPFQFTNAIQGGNMGFVRLNPITYSCMPLMTNDGNPYPIPPFLPALKNIDVQLDATDNISSIIRKMGLLGFIDVSMDVPEAKSGESDEAYRSRLAKRLQDYAKAYKGNLSKGVAVHYKDQEIKHNATNAGAAAGAKAVWEMNEEQVFSGIDTPPSMCGRSYSTTETYATQDYDRTISKIGNGRRMIKRFLEKGYTLDLLLRGIDASVNVAFKENAAFREKEKQEAEDLRIKNVLAKRDGGIINDDEAAQELGYEKATGTRAATGKAVNSATFTFNRVSGRYEHQPEVITVHLEQPPDDRRDQSYQAALEAVLSDPEEKAIAAAIAAGEAYDHMAGTRAAMKIIAQRFALVVWNAFATTLRSEVGKSSVMRICKRFVSDEWQRWRYEDTNHLHAGWRPRRLEGEAIDIAVVDASALAYITKIEDFYFGRGNYLARNETVGKEFITWLQEEYIVNGLNIRDAATWNEFKTKFAGLVNETSFQKIEQLVSTTMSRIQNMGQTLSLYENGFKRYTIVGPVDKLTCKHCRAMVGRIFEVKVAAERLARIVSKGFEQPSDLPPFLTSQYTEAQVKELTDAELQAAGFETAPFHPKCRHRKAAVD
jgi:hypothetical protein